MYSSTLRYQLTNKAGLIQYYSNTHKHTQTCLVFGEQWLVQSPKLFFLRPMRERERERERERGGGGEIQTDRQTDTERASERAQVGN